VKEWDIISSRYNSTFLSPTDFHLHYKHIIHRCLATKNRFATGDNNCRFCGCHEETSSHIGECEEVRKLFAKFDKLVAGGSWFKRPRTAASKQALIKNILFTLPFRSAPRGVVHLM
jgi:hypothetical protein